MINTLFFCSEVQNHHFTIVRSELYCVFGSVVAVTFHSKTYQNNIFFILKKLFLTSAHQNDLKI